MLTRAVKLRRVEAIINPLAGGVGATALAEMKDLLAGFGLNANVHAIDPGGLERALNAALEREPDLLVTLAGDGTARAACELCGPNGPLIAPLPGGTMNMLPRTLYGDRDWKAALSDSLERGVERTMSGGEIDGRNFYVAAMVGWPAMWGRAREAAREHELQKAFERAREATQRAFKGWVHFTLDDGPEARAQALTFLCPSVSKRMHAEIALEVAALDPSGLTAAVRVGVRAFVGDLFGDWRDDPAVDMGCCRKARAWSRGGLPGLVDGEPVRLHNPVEVRFVPNAFRALAPAAEDIEKF